MNYKNFCQVLAHIERNPGSWDQGSYYTKCFAGIAADIAGCKSLSATDRRLAAERFLGVTDAPRALGLFQADRTLDSFRCIRLVMARTTWPKRPAREFKRPTADELMAKFDETIEALKRA